MKKLSTLYIDESGKSSLVEKAEEPFILTGVILDEDEKNPIEGFFSYIKRKYHIDTNLPFHSYDIFENPETRKLSDSAAASLLDSLADFISLIPIRVHIMEVNKKQFKSALGVVSDNDFKGSSEKKEMKEFPYRISSCMLFKWFAHYLKQNGSIGEIIVDARRKMSSMNKIKLELVWNEIKKKLYKKNLDNISQEEVKAFFKIKKDEVYKYLKRS